MESQLFPWSAFDERCNICGPVCPTLTTLTSPFLTRNPYIGWSGRWLKRELTLMRNHVASDVDYVQLHLFRYGRFGRAARLARKPAGCFVFTGRSSSVCVCVCVCVFNLPSGGGGDWTTWTTASARRRILGVNRFAGRSEPAYWNLKVRPQQWPQPGRQTSSLETKLSNISLPLERRRHGTRTGLDWNGMQLISDSIDLTESRQN